MNFKRLSPLLALLICGMMNAQEGIPVYSDYLSDNLYLLHPSMAGAANSNQVRLTARQQWFDQNEAPNLQTLAFNARIADQSGIGAILFNDQNGYHSQTGGYLTYAHHIMFSRTPVDLNQLSFGLSVGLVQSSLDETNFDLNDFDPVIAGIIQSSSYFNVDVGASYNFLDFSAHFTVKNLIFRNRGLFTEEFESANQRRYIFSTAYTFGTAYSGWTFEPSTLFQLTERTGEKFIDLNFKAYKELDFGTLWGALSYRRSFDGAEFLDGVEIGDQKLQLITPVVGVNWGQGLFAYTYSYQIGTVRFDTGGFHQITLGFDFGKRREEYDCNCPAIN